MMRRMGLLCVVLAGCFSSPSPGANKLSGDEQKEGFAMQAAGDVKPAPFDGKRAMQYLESICKIGPRQSATKGMREQVELITKHFADLGLKVEVQAFKGKQESRAAPVDMNNLIIRFHPDRERRIILCSHYDTRPIADQEPDPRDWKKTFISANDGGSGVALMMELAHHMKNLKLNVGVDFVLFDGEEYIFDRNIDRYFIGSEHFAQTYAKNPGKVKYGAAVLLDMIGGKGAKFPLEGNSWQKARELCTQIWTVAKEQDCKMFQNKMGDTVLDDHISLQDVGIPAIDIIDFSYVHWHRLSDVPAQCSAESLTEVSKVLSVWMQRVK